MRIHLHISLSSPKDAELVDVVVVACEPAVDVLLFFDVVVADAAEPEVEAPETLVVCDAVFLLVVVAVAVAVAVPVVSDFEV